MKIKIKGEMAVAGIRQALFEILCSLEEDYAVRYLRDATLYVTPTNGFGDEVVPRSRNGREVNTIYSDGPYRCSADEYGL